MPTTLRIALLAGILALAANLAVIGFIHWQTHDQAVSALSRQVEEQSAVLTDVYRSSGGAGLQRVMRDSAEDPQVAAAILAPTGKPVAGNVAALSTPMLPLKDGYRSVLLRLNGEATPREAAVVLHRIGGGRWLLSGRTVPEGLSLRQTLERSLGVAIALSVLLGLLCGLIIGKYVDRRVSDVVAVADRISGGDMSQRVPLTGGSDAFDRLARRINQMLDRIGTLMSELRMLTDSLAHDLRSPVGRLRAAADAAISADDADEREQRLGDVIKQADSLMRILTTALEIGRSEALTSRNQFSWFDPVELAAELTEMYEPVAEEAGLAMRFDAHPPALPLFGHRQLLAQALSNLIENALKYGRSGGEVAVQVRHDEAVVKIAVADRGPGIAPEQRQEARRRFGRLDESRSAEGAGLGLALVEAIAHLHEGELVLEDNDPGLVACICLPASARI
ncbi:MAG: HAMP domain-containing sensor histidine kinase [Sphingomicrobium sp.]